MSEGDKAVLTILVFAALYDAWAIGNDRETISAAVYRGRKWSRPLGFFLALHFEHILPPQWDPLRRWWR